MTDQQYSGNDVRNTIREQSLFMVLDNQTQKALISSCKAIDLKPGQSAFMQGARHEYSYIIQSGLMRTYYISETGREVTLGEWSEGDLIGGPLVFGGGTHVWSAVASRQSRLLAISGEDLRKLASQNTQIYPWLIDVMSFKLAWLSNLFQVHGTEQVQKRLAKLLLMLGDIYGHEEPYGTVIRHSIMQSNLASLVGASRQWTNKNLNILKKHGLITNKDHHIVLLDPDKLKRLVEGNNTL